MAVRTEQHGRADATRDPVGELDALRLQNDWSYRELAADMKRVADVILSPATLHQILADRSIQPFDRTLYKIRQYLDQRAPVTPRRRAVR
jgi:transcriptional regulator with XRE-family HTH domain